jgi:monovalent cation:H+ antiporter-2, CPA2 family
VAELGVLRDLLVLFGLGVAVVVLFHRVRIPPIVGFLITGVVCGPYGFGLIEGVHQVEALAEIGVVLLLFTVGIEFSIQQLMRIRRFLVLGGGLQMAFTMLTTTVLAHFAGLAWSVSVFLGMLVALSSTAIVLRMLADRGEMATPAARAALAILIFQDLCIVPLVLFTPYLGGTGGEPVTILWVVVKALLFLIGAVIAARYVVPRLLRIVVDTRKREVFLLTIILLCLGTAWISSRIGLSLALGAFIAGLIISESEYSHQALGEMLPLREVFNSLFFVSMGMLFDVRSLLAHPVLIVSALAATVVVKAVVSTGVSWGLGLSLRTAVISAFAISQIGEFSFVLSKVGLDAGLLDAGLYQLFLAVAVGTMALTPALHAASPAVAGWLGRHLPRAISAGRGMPGLDNVPASPLSDHVIVVGFGLNGRNLSRVLDRNRIPYIAVEMNPDTVRHERDRGVPVIFGDASRPEILEHAGITGSRVVVIAISDLAATRSTVATIRQLNPHVHIVARARYTLEVDPLLSLGADEVVTEEYETSIEIFARVLRRFFVPRDEIDRSVKEIRRGGYEAFRSISREPTSAVGLERFLSNIALEVYRAEEGSPIVGLTLMDSNVRGRSGVSIVAVQRSDGTMLVNPQGSDTIDAGDAVLLLGLPDQILTAGSMFRNRPPRPAVV